MLPVFFWKHVHTCARFWIESTRQRLINICDLLAFIFATKCTYNLSTTYHVFFRLKRIYWHKFINHTWTLGEPAAVEDSIYDMIIATYAYWRFFSRSSTMCSTAGDSLSVAQEKVTAMETEKQKKTKVLWPQWIAAIGGT